MYAIQTCRNAFSWQWSDRTKFIWSSQKSSGFYSAVPIQHSGKHKLSLEDPRDQVRWDTSNGCVFYRFFPKYVASNLSKQRAPEFSLNFQIALFLFHPSFDIWLMSRMANFCVRRSTDILHLALVDTGVMQLRCVQGTNLSGWFTGDCIYLKH